jgi:hypothetical protein
VTVSVCETGTHPGFELDLVRAREGQDRVAAVRVLAIALEAGREGGRDLGVGEQLADRRRLQLLEQLRHVLGRAGASGGASARTSVRLDRSSDAANSDVVRAKGSEQRSIGVSFAALRRSGPAA